MYEACRAEVLLQKSKKGQHMILNPSEDWIVCWCKGESRLIVAKIPNYFSSSEGVAKGIAKSLNEGKVLLPLQM